MFRDKHNKGRLRQRTVAWAKKEGKEPKKGTQASPAQAKLSPDS